MFFIFMHCSGLQLDACPKEIADQQQQKTRMKRGDLINNDF
jgi:hypothetical protein